VTDGLDQALSNAVPALLELDELLTVFRGGVPNPTQAPPYVVVRSVIRRPSDDPDNSGDGRSRVWVADWYVYSVGGGAGTPQDAEIAAIAVAQRVRTQLLDVRPAVQGFAAGSGGPRPPQENRPPPPPHRLGPTR
jgi:hypothetical protein